MTKFRLGLIAAACAFAAAQNIDAQDSKNAALAGVVRDTVGRPLSGVEVVADGNVARAVSDNAGRFHVSGVPPGKNGFVIRKVGFQPISFETTLDAGKTVVVRVKMSTTQSLNPVIVSAPAVQAELARVGFYDREKAGQGHFLDPAKVERLSHVANPSQLLRDIPGLDIRCGVGGCGLTSNRGCLNTYIDGIYFRPARRNVSAIDEAVSTFNVGAVEVYQGLGGVPAQFSRGSCGAIVVWTKTRIGA